MKRNVMVFLGCLFSAQVLSVELIDQNNRQVMVPDKVERLVAIPIPLASMVMALDGGGQRLVGINQGSNVDFEYGLLGKMFPHKNDAAMNMAGENFVPNVEALAAAQPDVVFQWGDRGEAIIQPISQLEIPVVTLRYGDSMLAAEWIRLVGIVLGKADRGEALSSWFEETSQAIVRRAAALDHKHKPRVIYLFRVRSGLQAAGQGTSMGGDIERTGGLNVAAEVPGFAPVSVEQLLTWDPEVILLNNFEPGLTPGDLFEDKRLHGVSAVRNKRVYLYPHGGFRWDPPSQETPLALDWMFSLLHPEEAGSGFRERIVESYRLLYEYALDADDLDRLLKIQANGKSAYYNKLFSKESQ